MSRRNPRPLSIRSTSFSQFRVLHQVAIGLALHTPKYVARFVALEGYHEDMVYAATIGDVRPETAQHAPEVC